MKVLVTGAPLTTTIVLAPPPCLSPHACPGTKTAQDYWFLVYVSYCQ